MSELEMSTPSKENPLLNNLHSKRAQWYSPCKSSPRKPFSPESDVPSLKLNHFSKIPRISFGNVKVGDSKTEPFIVLNPHLLSQTLTLEKCPAEKGFSVDPSEYGCTVDSGELTVSVPPKEEVFLSIKWEPKEKGSYREIIRFVWDNSHRLQVIVFGTAVGPNKVKTSKGNVRPQVHKKSSKAVLQPSQVLNTCSKNVVEHFEIKNISLGTGVIPGGENRQEEDMRRDTFVVKGNKPQISNKVAKPASTTQEVKPKKIGSGQKRKKLSPTSGPIRRKPKTKVKLKVSAKGVPQRRLQLVKATKSSLPRHPMPFAAKNMYYDERWIEKQQEGFTRWLNYVLTPTDEAESTTQDSRKGTVALGGIKDVKKSQPLAPTREVLSLKAYTARRKMARLRRSACLLYQSEPLSYIIRKVEAEVENGRLAIRPDKKLHADLGIKRQVVEMILSYNTLWLRIGLETVYGEILPIHSNNDVTGLTRFIADRLLGNPDIARLFSHPQVPGLYREGYVEQLGKFTLKKFLLLVLFLDRAKLTRLIDHDPCLFNKDAVFKSSRSLLLSFSREYLKGEGDVTKHLSFLGYAVTHSQKAIDEVDYAVKNIATDLRDGLRLTRVVELLTRDWQLSASLRVPAISRLQKIHNVEVFMNALKMRDVLLGGGNGNSIDARHIVDGHREKTLALLWQIIFHFQVNVLLSKKQLQEEITHLESTARLRTQLTAAKGWIEGDHAKEARRDSTDLYSQSELLRLLLKWCKIVCSIYGVKIENFTVSFSDGRALCYLLHHYHPTLLPLTIVKQRTTLTCNPGVQEGSDSEGEGGENLWTTAFSPGSGRSLLFEELSANERDNFRLMADKVQELGGVPLMTKAADMSNTIPDEKVVITYVAYLCARLLDLREETKAARCIQMAWRRHRLKSQLEHKKNITKIVALVQARARASLARRRFRLMKQAAVLIQSVYRGRCARNQLQARHCAARRIQSHYQAYKQGREVLEWFTSLRQTVVRLQVLIRCNQGERQMKRSHAATLVQATWRGYHARRRFHEQRAACVKLQCLARRAIELKHFKRLKQATCLIQRTYRAVMEGRKLKESYLHLRMCAVKLQSFYRGKRDRVIVGRMRAAIKIQSHVRALQTRKKFLHLKQETVKMQSCVRKCQAQRRFNALKAAVRVLQVRVRAFLLGRQQRMEYQKLKSAAVKIQSLARGFIQRRAFMKQRRGAITIQSQVRRYLLQKNYQKLVASTVLIQTRFREALCTKKSHRNFLRMKRSAVKIQSVFRGYRCRELLKRVKQAVITIQSYVRCRLNRKRFLALKHAVVLMQARYRALLHGKRQTIYYQRIRQALIHLQAVTRGNIVRRQLLNQHLAAAVIQTTFRRYAAMKSYRQLKRSAVAIQRRYRSVLAIRAHALRWSSVLRIQAAYRGYRARLFFKVLKATVILQSSVRGWKAREELKRQHLAASVIQRSYRTYVATNRYQSLRQAAIVVQLRFRALCFGREVRSNFRRMQNAAVKIQSFFRGYQARKQVQRYRCATKIQAAYRGLLARKSFRAVYKSVVYVQAIARGYLARKHVASLKRVTVLLQRRYRARVIGMCQYVTYHVQRGACIVLQATWRGYLCRKRYHVVRHTVIVLQQRYRAMVEGKNQRERFLTMKTAVTHLQACARGWRDRRAVMELRAARLIQATYKMHTTRQEYLACRRAVVLMQAQTRMVQHRRRFEELKKATLVLQRRFRATKLCRQKQLRVVVLMQAQTRMLQHRRRFEELKKATLVVQRRFRATKLCRQEQLMYHFTRGAVITLQMVVRGHLVRTRMRKRIIAAIKIQTHFRGLLEKKRYEATKRAALVLQLRCRAWLLGRAVAGNYATLKCSALVIQSCYRNYRSCCLRKRQLAAVKIQRSFRRWRCRSTFIAMKTSAVVIQITVRGFLTRKSYLKLRSGTLIIQRRFRAQRKMHEAKDRYEVLRKACITVQTWVRGWLCRRRYIAIKTAVISMQQYHRACVRARKDRTAFSRLKNAAVCLQSYVKMHVARSWFERTKKAVVQIQAASRMRKERKRYLSLKESTIALQRRHRANQLCKQQQADYKRKRECVIALQAYFRGFKARQMVQRIVEERARREEAAVKIQQFYRSFRFMKETYFVYHVIRGAIITIQSAYRMFAARTFVRKLTAAITIQAFYRGTVQRRKYVAVRQTVCKLQATVRRKQETRQLERTRKAVVIVQQRYRAQSAMRKNREEFDRLRLATVTIQSYFRRRLQRQAYLATRRKVVKAQAVVRMRLQRTKFLKKRTAAVLVQRCYRSYVSSKEIQERYNETRKAVRTIQTFYRGWRARCEARKLRSAILIQSRFRGFVKRRTYLHTRQVIIRMQAMTRTRRCYKEYHALRKASVCLQRRIRAINVSRKARQDFILARRAVVKLQSCYRGWKARTHIRRVCAVCRIQRWFLAMLEGQRVRVEYRNVLKATLVLQAAYRGYCGRLIARDMRAARTIQSAVRGFITRKQIQRQKTARQAQLIRFASAIFHHAHAIVIQRRFRKARALALAKARMDSVLLIQCWWRGVLARQRFTKLTCAVQVIQRAARRRLEKKHKNAARIQAFMRGVLARKHVREMRASALRIQALWRGYLVRRNATAGKVEKARRRIQSANAAASESMKLCNRTRSALDFLLRCKNISKILEALINLEVVTRLSWVCCEQVVNDGALPVIFKVIKKCNRSLPHMEIIKSSISILVNVAKCPSAYRAVYEEPDSIDTLVELLTNFRDKSAVFSTTCCLLVMLCRDTSITQDVLNMTKAVENIKSLYNLAERKYKLETKRNTIKSKTEKSACQRAPPTPCKHTPYKGKHTPYKARKSDWLQWRERVNIVQDPLEAVRSLVRCLGLETVTVVE